MYRYRATNALFPFCPPYRYPYARIIRRFFIGAITVAILAFVLILLLLTSTFGMLEMKAVWYVFLSALVCAAPVLLCGLVLAWLRRYRNLRSVLLVALAGTLFWCGIVLYYEHARFQLFDFYRLPSKLSFLRNLFIPALTPTPLPPGEGLFRIQALASVSCKIVVWKDVY